MTEQWMGFIIWSLVGSMFIILGVCSVFSKTPAGFWANVKTVEVTDIRKYNCACAKLFCAFGIVMILGGVPILWGGPWIVVSLVGIMAEVIAAMAVYILVIEKRYRKRR